MTIFLAIIFLCLVPSFGEETTSSVITLTENDFTPKTSSGHWYIKFYSPSCSHCQELAPTWEKLSILTKGTVHVAKVDCTLYEGLCARYHVRGFPSILLLVEGKESFLFAGRRTIGGFVKFFNEKVGANVLVVEETEVEETGGTTDVVVLTEDNFVAETKEGSVLVKFYAPRCEQCKPLKPIWEKLATEQKANFKTTQVDCTIENELCQEYEVKGLPSIKLFIDGVEGSYSGQRTYADLVKFVEKEKKATLDGTRVAKPRFQLKGPSLVVPLTPENFDDITSKGIVAVKFCSLSSGLCRRLASIWEELAVTAKDIVTASVDCTVYHDLCTKQKVFSVPGMKLFISGKSVFYNGPPSVKAFMGYITNMEIIFKRQAEEALKKDIEKKKNKGEEIKLDL